MLVKQLLRLLVAHPLLEDSQLFGIFLDVGQRHLVGTPKTFNTMTAHFLRRAPTFRRAQHDHRPARPLGNASRPAFPLMLLDFENAVFDGRSHCLVHAVRIGALHEVRCPSAAPQQVLQFFVCNTRQQSGIVNFVAVQVKDGQHRPVPNWVQKLADVPGGRERAGFIRCDPQTELAANCCIWDPQDGFRTSVNIRLFGLPAM